MTNSRAVAHKSWVGSCSPSTLGFTRSNLHNSQFQPLSLPSHHKDFSLPAPLSSFKSFKWVQISLHINLWLWIPCTQSYHTHTFKAMTPLRRIFPHATFKALTPLRRIFPSVGLDKEILTSSHSFFPLIYIRNKKLKSCSQHAFSFLWVEPRTKWCNAYHGESSSKN